MYLLIFFSGNNEKWDIRDVNYYATGSPSLIRSFMERANLSSNRLNKKIRNLMFTEPKRVVRYQ